MKKNMECLRKFIDKNVEAIELWDAISKEIETDRAKIKSLQDRVLETTSGRTGLGGYTQTIDCGIGTIKYKTDNLRLQQLMSEVKEKLESEAKFGVLPESANVLFS